LSDPDISDLGLADVDAGYRDLARRALPSGSRTNPRPDYRKLNLPVSGKDLLVGFSSQGIRAPFIVIAEKGQENDVIQAFRLGADDVLFWPARDAEVAAVVERALSQTREARARQRRDRRLKETNAELQRKVQQLTTILATGKAVVSQTDQRSSLTTSWRGRSRWRKPIWAG
jgi:DNA-binding NarL/FixJ family response regulator